MVCGVGCMIVKFLGVKGERKKTGCPVCGTRVRTSNTISYTKRMILPTGRVMIFVLNKSYEVSDEEAKFLLDYHYAYNREELYPFVKC